MVSASEINGSFREFLEWNYPATFRHIFPTIDAQNNGTSVCCLCKDSTPTRIFGCCKPEENLKELGQSEPDLMMTGSPCNPYSIQRSKRFSDDSVEGHYQFQVTDKSTVELVMKYEPKKWVFEQVMGFTMPFSTSTTETPKDRFPGIE